MLQRVILLLTLSSLSYAEIDTGQPLPALSIEEPGELILESDTIRYRQWHSDSLKGKLHVLQYLAGRMSASKINEPFTDRLDTLELPPEWYQVTTIINLDDTFFGTSGFVNSELKNNKKKYPDTSIVADKHGLGLATWQLQEQGSAIAVLSPSGKVLFFKDGALSEQEIDQVVTLIQAQVDTLARNGSGEQSQQDSPKDPS